MHNRATRHVPSNPKPLLVVTTRLRLPLPQGNPMNPAYEAWNYDLDNPETIFVTPRKRSADDYYTDWEYKA